MMEVLLKTCPLILTANRFSANIENLDYEKVYLATIVESQSGSNARSSTFQIFRKSIEDTPAMGPLKITPVSQYACVTRLATQQGHNYEYDKMARLHFYFASIATPPGLPPEVRSTVCHDVNLHGLNDSPLYPRLELIPQHFALWDPTDRRFVDLNNDGLPDINTEIQDKLERLTGNRQNINVFSLLNWPNMPSVENLEQNNNPNLGLFMIPWINPLSGQSYCPKQTHYNGSEPIFKILKEIVGTDTEALYFAESEPVVQSPGNYTQDVMIIREGLLKKIWFYYENYRHLTPDQVTANSKTIHFYWPPDPLYPHIRKSTQRIYTIRYPSEIGKNGNQSGLSTNISPPDKRFGCAPSIGP